MSAVAQRRLAVVRPKGDASARDDAELIAAAIEGDPSAAGAIWDRYSKLVRGVLRRTLGPGRDVEDQVQDVFLQLFKDVGALRDPSALKSFLIGVAIRVARAELRRRRVRRWLWLTDDGTVPDAAGEAIDEDGREAVKRLYTVLDRMDDQGRMIFALRFIEGLELTDVAAAMDVSLATAKRHLSRVTERVRLIAGRDPVLSTYIDEVSHG
jgi:RNA polymerase sigma-70 factor (ECF subfamily)